MKQIQWMLLALAITLTASSCFINVNDDDGFFGSCVNGSPLYRFPCELAVAPFDGIELPISADVFIARAPSRK